MIRMVQSQSSAQAKDYHNNALAQSDYYLGDQELKGSFQGRIAKRLGIEGKANKIDFDALVENLNPVTGKRLTPRNVKDRTVGYDINFHCPKSVSVLHVLSKDDHILEAFRTSVRETMQDIEADSKTTVRKNKEVDERQTGELVWAEFVHQTARPVADAEPDPHLHAHCFTFNVTWDKAEKKYKAGQWRDIKRDMPYYEARFHKKLADHLVALGYQVRRTRTSFEVVGVPNQVIDLFSKRTNEIGQIANERNITSAKELDALGSRTRSKKKKGLTMAQLKQDWIRQIRAAGLQDGDKGGDPLRYNPKRKLESVTPAECVDHALLHRFERASVFQDRRILESAYRFAIGKADTAVDQITKQFAKDKRIIQVKDGSRMMCTTREVLAEERRMVQLAQAGKGKLVPLYASPPSLSFQGEQEVAATHVLTTSDHVSIIKGGAGTGKTTLMKETVAKINDVGIQVITVAPTAQAARGVLRDEGFKDADTVAKLLADPALQEKLNGQVLWVDEAGLLGTKDMIALLELAEKYNARLILSGDTRQHSAVVRGDALRILESVAGITPATVNKIYRQKSKEYREAVQDLADGNVKRAFAKLDALESIKQTDKDHPNDGLVSDYIDTLQRGKTALVISPTHKQGEQVTDAIRGKLREFGKIGKKDATVSRLVNLNLTEAEKSDAYHYMPGLVLQFNQNRPGIKRGSQWSIVATADKQLTIQDREGKTASLPLSDARHFDVFRKEELSLSSGDMIRITRNGIDLNDRRLNNGEFLQVVSVGKGKITARNPNSEAECVLPDSYGHLTHAYCITSHASQGKTVDEVFISQPATTFPATDMKQFYVSVSRGRDRVHIYTDDKDALLDHASQSGDRVGAMELVDAVKNPVAFKMIRRRRHDQLVMPPRPVEQSSQQPLRLHAPKLTP